MEPPADGKTRTRNRAGLRERQWKSAGLLGWLMALAAGCVPIGHRHAAAHDQAAAHEWSRYLVGRTPEAPRRIVARLVRRSVEGTEPASPPQRLGCQRLGHFPRAPCARGHTAGRQEHAPSATRGLGCIREKRADRVRVMVREPLPPDLRVLALRCVQYHHPGKGMDARRKELEDQVAIDFPESVEVGLPTLFRSALPAGLLAAP